MKKKSPLQSLKQKASGAGINRSQLSFLRELITYQVNKIENDQFIKERKYREACDKVGRKYGIYNMLATTDEQKKRNKVIITELKKIESPYKKQKAKKAA